jgi:hypothetical protein
MAPCTRAIIDEALPLVLGCCLSNKGRPQPSMLQPIRFQAQPRKLPAGTQVPGTFDQLVQGSTVVFLNGPNREIPVGRIVNVNYKTLPTTAEPSRDSFGTNYETQQPTSNAVYAGIQTSDLRFERPEVSDADHNRHCELLAMQKAPNVTVETLLPFVDEMRRLSQMKRPVMVSGDQEALRFIFNPHTQKFEDNQIGIIPPTNLG